MAKDGKRKNADAQAAAKPVLESSPAAAQESGNTQKRKKLRVKKSASAPAAPRSDESGDKATETKSAKQQKSETSTKPAKKADKRPAEKSKEQRIEEHLLLKEQNKRTVFVQGLGLELGIADLRKKFPKAEAITSDNVRACRILFPSLEDAQAVAKQKEIKVNGHMLAVRMLVIPPGEDTGFRRRRTILLAPIPAGLELDQIQKKFPSAESVTLTSTKFGCLVVVATVEEAMGLADLGQIEIDGHELKVKYRATNKLKRSASPSEDEPKAKRIKI